MIAKYVTPWKYRREQEQRRVAALRQRDGDNCRRCRRPIRFDLPLGHDKGPKSETIFDGADEEATIDSLCLCHGRCNSAGADHTDEVTKRICRKSEAALLSRSRRRRNATSKAAAT